MSIDHYKRHYNKIEIEIITEEVLNNDETEENEEESDKDENEEESDKEEYKAFTKTIFI